MTIDRAKTIEMARQANGYDGREGLWWFGIEDLERFAALVRAEVMREMADSGHSATAPRPSSYDATALHAAIMNLPSADVLRFVGTERSYIGAYMKGHRDARHVAAELVAEALSVTRRPRE